MGILGRVTERYMATDLARLLSAAQPVGVFLAIIGVALAGWTVKLSLDEAAQSRKVREAQLFASLMERLGAARQIDTDAQRSATKRDKKDKYHWYCVSGGGRLRAQAGQVQVLERMNALRIDFRDLQAEGVNLVVWRERRPKEPGLKLRGAKLVNAELGRSYLKHADLSDAKLMSADLERACLEDAKLVGANLTDADAKQAVFEGADLTDAILARTRLSYARFLGTDFTRTVLTDAEITGADLSRAKGLEQWQLDQACANGNKRQPEVPRGRKWNARECP